MTHEILAGSPAINAGDPGFDAASFDPPMTTDQRGVDREQAGRSTSVAVESAFFPAIPSDFDQDADVDGNDFLLWQRGAGTGRDVHVGWGCQPRRLRGWRGPGNLARSVWNHSASRGVRLLDHRGCCRRRRCLRQQQRWWGEHRPNSWKPGVARRFHRSHLDREYDSTLSSSKRRRKHRCQRRHSLRFGPR